MTVAAVPPCAQVTCYRLPVIPADHRLARFGTDPASFVWITWHGDDRWAVHRHAADGRYVWDSSHGWVLDDRTAQVRYALASAFEAAEAAAGEVLAWLEARHPE